MTTFEVLAEPTRRRILDLLRVQARPVGELVGLLGMSQPGVSKHLRVLRDAGLVRVRQDAQRRWYELRLEPLAEVDAWLDPYRMMWTARLDDLERHLGATGGADPRSPVQAAVFVEGRPAPFDLPSSMPSDSRAPGPGPPGGP